MTSTETQLPETLFAGGHRVNLYYLHEMFRHTAQMVRDRLQEETGIDVPITAGMWAWWVRITSHGFAWHQWRARSASVRPLPCPQPCDSYSIPSSARYGFAALSGIACSLSATRKRVRIIPSDT